MYFYSYYLKTNSKQFNVFLSNKMQLYQQNNDIPRIFQDHFFHGHMLVFKKKKPKKQTKHLTGLLSNDPIIMIKMQNLPNM